jgi:hypothetical protein
MLHIVDGGSTAASLRLASLRRGGKILSWRDALYEGPVPNGLSMRQLSRMRSRYWTGKGATAFDKRDATLSRFSEYDEVVLWFGGTSICQLSLLQVLDWFSDLRRSQVKLSLVSAYGGWLKPEPILFAFEARQPVTSAQKRLGRRAWAAFRAPSPMPLLRLLGADLRALPEIRETILELLQEYPETHSGLSRLERKLLRSLEFHGAASAGSIVGTALHSELVGDTLLLGMLRGFLNAPHPLIRFVEPIRGEVGRREFHAARIGITETGREVLAGAKDHIALNGVDRWIGGVHLEGHGVQWRWDDRAGAIVPQPKRRKR